MTSSRIEPLPGYTPAIGRLVGMLAWSRRTLLDAVEGLTRAELDHLHDARSNSIGALLAHAAAVERWHQILTFEERQPTAEEQGPLLAALDLGEAGRRQLRGRELDGYLGELATVRAATLAALAARDDAWLEAPLAAAPEKNAHWAWFHVAEDEISHRGQIRWLRARLPGRASVEVPPTASPRALVETWIERFNAGDAEGLAALYAEDAVNHQVTRDPVRGREAIRAMFAAEFAAAEMVCLPEAIHEAGDVVALEWRDPLGLRGCGFFTVVAGRIVHQRGYWDELAFLRMHGLPIR